MLRVLLIILAVPLALPGCSSFGATTLRCGVDGESSFVELVNMPQSVSTESRYYADLCGFAYEGDS